MWDLCVEETESFVIVLRTPMRDRVIVFLIKNSLGGVLALVIILVTDILVAQGETWALETEWQTLQNLQDDIRSAAFDTTVYFEDGFAEPDIQISYVGFQGDPVWSMRIARGSLIDHADTGNWRARIIMAPGLDESNRPRKSGMNLIGQALRYREKHPNANISEILDNSNLQWLETDTRTCPALKAGLMNASQITWLLPFFQRRAHDEFVVVAVTDSDQVNVKFRNRALNWHAEYRGSVDDGNPADWAVNLRKSLTPCWKSASIPVPWRAKQELR